jgi:hypothetical protein
MITLRTSFAALAVALALTSVPALAQIDPEGGDVWVPPADEPPPPQQDPGQQGGQPWYQGGPTGQERPPPVNHEVQPQQQVQQPSQQPSDGRSDHARVVGHVAFGTMNFTNIPLGGLGSPGTNDTITAPAIGIRYWVGDLVGVDLGVGLGFIGGSVDTGDESIPVDNAFALAIHGGLPLAIFHALHYSLLIVPEVNIGFATGTLFGSDPDDDRGRSGFVFQLGGRVGTEIHFGFMQIPNLSLQASVGLYFQYSSASVGASRRAGSEGVGAEGIGLSTTVLGQPWEILVGSLSALYYF